MRYKALRFLGGKAKTAAICILLSICMFLPGRYMVLVDGNTQTDSSIFDISDENAYVLLDRQIKENKCDFLDGNDLQVTDATHPLYNEILKQDGVEGRLFSANNYLSVKLGENFCTDNDSEFLVTIVYYDFGPKEGTFYFDYYDKEGLLQTKNIIKPGNVQRFNAETIYVSNLDVKRTFKDTGATIRFRTSGKNLFKKVEIVNLSSFIRENRSLDELAALPSKSSLDALASLGIIDAAKETFFAENISKKCVVTDAKELLDIIDGKNNKIPVDTDGIFTQGELTDMYLQALGLDRGETPAVQYARETGLVKNEDLFYSDDIPAVNYNMLEIAYNALYFVKTDGTSMLEALLANDFFNNELLMSNESLIVLRYKHPKKLAYKTVTENVTGQTYNYMNICGMTTTRTYVTAQNWSSDGKSFVCGFLSGLMFVYNTETQMLTYIDKTVGNKQLPAVVGTDDFVYYPKVNDKGEYSLWKANLTKTPIVPEFVSNGIGQTRLGMLHITNDCKYISSEVYGADIKGGSLTARYSVEDDDWITYKHPVFSYSPTKNHDIINPEYPNLFSFSHEINGVKAYNIYDRIWQVDLDTMQAKNIFKQGLREDGRAVQGATHELWSIDGEYMYFVSYNMGATNNLGAVPAVVRFDKDGSHRKYYHCDDANFYLYQHCTPSGDNKYVVADGNYVVIISTETWETFPISKFEWNGMSSHPYHPHAIIARNHYVVNWGGKDLDGTLGVKWYDFTQLVSSQAKGGHYEMGENVSRASYQGLECESSEITIKGREAVYAKGGKSIYIDISEQLIDTDNGKIKLSFDYLDNGILPINVIYTSGVNNDNQRYRIFDNKVSINRRGTNTWKHAEIVIDSGNFEDIGKFDSDIRISGKGAHVYLYNVKASLPN